MKRVLLLFVFAVLAALWTQQKLSAGRMAMELTRLHQQQGEVAALLREREHLRQRVSEADKSEITAQEFTGLVDQKSPARLETGLSPTMPLGDWVGMRAWGFRGQATPQATIESALWAGAGGDVATLRQLLFVSNETRAVAAELLLLVPASFRQAYPSPDELISALTIKRIPLGEAQLVWLHQSGPDNATACVFLRDPLNPIGSNQPEPVLQDTAKIPPQLPQDKKTVAEYLSLQREGECWRLVVPPAAIKKMVRELRGGQSGS